MSHIYLHQAIFGVSFNKNVLPSTKTGRSRGLLAINRCDMACFARVGAEESENRK